MDELWIVLVGPVLKLALAVIAVFMVWAVLRGLDWLNTQPFTAAQRIMDDNALAVGLYRGLRFLAVALLIGLLLS